MSQMDQDFACVVFSYINSERKEVEVSSGSQYKRFASIRSLKSSIPPRKARLSWTTTLTAEPGSSITPTSFYNVKHNSVPMTILEPGLLHMIPNSMTIHQTRIVGLTILEEDGICWVGSHAGRGFFHALEYFKMWTLKILKNHDRTLWSVGIYDAVLAF